MAQTGFIGRPLEAASRFQLGGIAFAADQIKTGHINDTYLVHVRRSEGDVVRKIVQRLNPHTFPDPAATMKNIMRVTEHLQAKYAGMPDASRRVLHYRKTLSGDVMYSDKGGYFWRCCDFIPNAVSVDSVADTRQAFIAAKAFAEFQCDLSDLPAPRLFESMRNLHNTPHRIEQLYRAVEADACNRASTVKKELESLHALEYLAPLITDALSEGSIPERVAHNDTKISNVMLDKHTGNAVCILDLDTVMPGASLYDFGDLVRVAVNPIREDERDLPHFYFRSEMYAATRDGFLAGFRDVLTAKERDLMPIAGAVISFELGMRYMTDYLYGDNYFRIIRPHQNLDRVRALIVLARAIACFAGA